MSNQDQEEKFDRYTLRRGGGVMGGVDVLGWTTYPENSVLAGQPRKVFLDNFEDEAKARKAYPKADQWSSKFTDPQVNLNHLPGENDPVPGGMYPDDWSDEPNSGRSYRP